MLTERLAQLRKQYKKTQQDVAAYLGITRPAYTNYESGTREPDNETLQKLADYFDVNTDYLLGRSNDPSPLHKLSGTTVGTNQTGFALRLQELRKQNNLKQKDIAEKLGITESAYGFYEQGRREPSFDTLSQLAEIFKVTVDYLVNGTLNMPTTTREALESGVPLYTQKDSEGYTFSKQMTKDELLNELTDDPDDLYFLDGYLEATEEEKKEIRRHWLEIKRQMRESKIKQASPISLRDFNEKIKKPD